ncbi:MAG: flavodoxin domain-containing protein [Pseudomonadota bacterium]
MSAAKLTLVPKSLDALTSAEETNDFIGEDAPFDEDQRVWLNGLFTGLQSVIASGSSEAEPLTALKILFGSQSGTAEALSKDLKKFAATQGFKASIDELDSTTPEEVAKLKHVLIIAATFGEGEPTDNAVNFYKALMDDSAAALPTSLNFSVCGLGDSSYPHFNKVAHDLDTRLAELGANRALPLTVCDVDYDDAYAEWKSGVFKAETFASAGGAAAAPFDAEPEKPGFDKNHPFIAPLMTCHCLSASESAKKVNHIELSLAGGGQDLEYNVGDALGLWPMNDMVEVDAILNATGFTGSEIVTAILNATGFTGSEIVTLKSGQLSLRQALFKMLDLMTVTAQAGEDWGVETGQDIYLIDILTIGVDDLTPDRLVNGLRPLQPRLYSISSSPKKHPGEVHLTVGEVHYELNDTARKGVASTYLGERLPTGGTVGVYVHKSSHFHLPDDDALPVIMIGPGTGIAPFRAFLEEREMRGATGKNWLFFGDQHEATDFLYRDEILAWQRSGLLTELDLAWSRDGQEKVYVQHLIRKAAETFFNWLEEGAAIFVCGDASRMAADVEKAILNVIKCELKSDDDGATAYLDNLKKQGRYQRDVY